MRIRILIGNSHGGKHGEIISLIRHYLKKKECETFYSFEKNRFARITRLDHLSKYGNFKYGVQICKPLTRFLWTEKTVFVFSGKDVYSYLKNQGYTKNFSF
jgi:hypothetical protein